MKETLASGKPLRRTMSRLLIPLLALAFPGLRSAAATGGADSVPVPVCVLSLASDPPGATVFLNGVPKGETPLHLHDQQPGEHRVRVVKRGYLENARVVKLRAGETRTVQVRLNPGAKETRSLVQSEEGQKKSGGGAKKPLLIGLGALGAGAVAYLALRDTNKPPVAALTIDVTVTPLMAATAVSFNGSGSSDPDGDALTYSWNFGDGSSGSGQTTTHVYNSAGVFSVTLTVDDGKKSATASGSVTVRSLTGVWAGNLGGLSGTFFTFTLNQSGTTVTGTYSDTVNGSGVIEGGLSPPRGVALINRVGTFRPGFWSGSLNNTVDRITGTVDWFEGGIRSFTLDRR